MPSSDIIYFPCPSPFPDNFLLCFQNTRIFITAPRLNNFVFALYFPLLPLLHANCLSSAMPAVNVLFLLPPFSSLLYHGWNAAVSCVPGPLQHLIFFKKLVLSRKLLFEAFLGLLDPFPFFCCLLITKRLLFIVLLVYSVDLVFSKSGPSLSRLFLNQKCFPFLRNAGSLPPVTF